jgi:hypothetical protein
MDFATIFFILVGALSVAAAVGVVSAKVVVHSALFLLVHFVTLAVLYITLDAQFLGAAQVIIYAGGIVILILFVIMLIGSGERGAGHPGQRGGHPRGDRPGDVHPLHSAGGDGGHPAVGGLAGCTAAGQASAGRGRMIQRKGAKVATTQRTP